jgi:hypothetical protein
MNGVIIENVIGTKMGTEKLNLEKYQNLWQKFENLLQKESLNLSSFSKKWDIHSGEVEDYHKFYDKIKKQWKRKDTLTRVKLQSIEQLEKYIKFLDKDFTAENIRHDETYSHWFD